MDTVGLWALPKFIRDGGGTSDGVGRALFALFAELPCACRDMANPARLPRAAMDSERGQESDASVSWAVWLACWKMGVEVLALATPIRLGRRIRSGLGKPCPQFGVEGETRYGAGNPYGATAVGGA